ncbi:hypothetical protein XI25_23815 [Paenibacillus sp. DMB20]|nr:hypothetical protein XI25_23815 [Paenibacillus sp. DMB20]
MKNVIGSEFGIIDLNEFQCLVLVPLRNGKKEDLQRLGERLIKWFKEHYLREVTVVIGGVLDRGSLFGQQFSEMETVLENKFFYDDSTVLFSHLASFTNEREADSMDEALMELTEDIKRRRYDIAKMRLAQLFEIMQNSDRFTVTYVKYLSTDIAKTLFEASVQKDPDQFQRHLDMVYKTSKLSDLKSVMLDIICFSEPAGDNSSETIRKAIEDVVHIIEHEYNTDLSLDILAERVYLTPSYLSHLFKRNKGISIIKYLTVHRMEQARRLLLTTNRKIAQISRDVGYTNIPYFSSLFKTHYGKTPTQFREEAAL